MSLGKGEIKKEKEKGREEREMPCRRCCCCRLLSRFNYGCNLIQFDSFYEKPEPNYIISI